jgi:hypothetical protein
MLDDNRHGEIVKNYGSQQNKYEFMLTIARDGEQPVRSIYHFGNALSAAEAYERYKDFGFAKEFLDVKLYEPNGVVNSKTLRRPPAGECSYVKENYISAVNLIKSFYNMIDMAEYNRLVEGFALIFSQDNIRFNSERFFEDLQYIKEND